ncbi:hypothetical protein ScPMuIL_013435 [Solemya velum]
MTSLTLPLTIRFPVIKLAAMEEIQEQEFSIPCHDIVYSVEFSKFEWSSRLLAVGTTSRVTLYDCQFQDENDEVDEFDYNVVRDFQIGCSVHALAWSPETSPAVVPKLFGFAAAGSDYKIRLCYSDGKDNDRVQSLEGHTDFVNSVTFEPTRGMSVCWHHEEPLKILVAQKNGIIKIFSLSAQQQIMSLDCGQIPLLAADWSKSNCLLIGAVAGSDWMTFDTSVSSQPTEKRQAHTEGANGFAWSRSQENVLATMGRPGRQVKAFNIRHHQVSLCITQPIAYGLSWHYKLPFLAVGGDRKVHIYRVICP